MIDINESLFLGSLEKFRKILVPIYNSERREEGLDPLTEQEIIDLFLDLRIKYKMTGDGQKARTTA